MLLESTPGEGTRLEMGIYLHPSALSKDANLSPKEGA